MPQKMSQFSGDLVFVLSFILLILVIVIFIIVMYFLRLFDLTTESYYSSGQLTTVHNQWNNQFMCQTLQVPTFDVDTTSGDVRTSSVLGPIDPDLVSEDPVEQG